MTVTALSLQSADSAPAAQPAAQDTKALGRARVEPLPTKETEGNAGLFVGIGKFDPKFGLAPLRFTPDDAVALAYQFVVELKLIPPARATVALGGEPESDLARSRLLQLEREKVRRIPATRNELFPAISAITRSSTDTNALIVMSFSTHGFEKEGRAYVMPVDGNREFIEETGIPLQTVKARLQEAKANKKLLIIDACRESPQAQTRGASRMNEQLLKALRQAEGMAILSSCAVGQLSWEADELKQGVFTYFLLKALEGAAPADARDGLIRLDKVAEFTIAETRKWVKQFRSEDQEPFFEGGIARTIPLAYSRIDREAAEKLKGRRSDGLRYLSDAYFAPGNLVPDRLLDEVQQAVNATEGTDLETLIANLEGLKGAKPAAIRLFVAWFDDWWGKRRSDKPAQVAAITPAAPTPRPQTPTAPTQPAPSGNRTQEIEVGGGVKMTLVRIPRGSFMMGAAQGSVITTSPDQNAAQVQDDSGKWFRLGVFLGTGVDIGGALQQNAQQQAAAQQQAPAPAYDGGEGWPQTRVRLTEDFWMSETEVTQGQWKAVMGTTLEQQQLKICSALNASPLQLPLKGVGDDLPMYLVSWNDATEFCGRLSQLTRRSFSLPTEAQWEYACRAGTATRFYFGDDERQIHRYGWTSVETGVVNPVKIKKPNAWGLYDMHGNVAEWCRDYFGNYPGGSVEDPLGVTPFWDQRAVRGGSWGGLPETATSSRRFRVPSTYAFPNLGFRVVAKDEQ